MPLTPGFRQEDRKFSIFSRSSNGFDDDRDDSRNASRQFVHQVSVPPFDGKLQNLELNSVISFFTRLSKYVHTYKYKPHLSTCLSHEVIRTLTIQYGQQFNPPVNDMDFVYLPDKSVEAMIRSELRARTKDSFVKQLSTKLYCKYDSSPSIAHFPEFMNAITKGASEFSFRLYMLYDPQNAEVCPDFDEKDQGLLAIFFALMREALNHDYVKLFWSRVPRQVTKRLKDDMEMTKPEKFDEFHTLLREKLRVQLKNSDISNTLLAEIQSGFVSSTKSTIKPIDRENNITSNKRKDFHYDRRQPARRTFHMEQEDTDSDHHYDNKDSSDHEHEQEDSGRADHDDDDDDFDNQLNAMIANKPFEKKTPVKNDTQGCHRMAKTGVCDKKGCQFSHDPSVLKKTAANAVTEWVKSKYYEPSAGQTPKLSVLTREPDSPV